MTPIYSLSKRSLSPSLTELKPESNCSKIRENVVVDTSTYVIYEWFQRGKVNRQSNWQRFGEFESGQRGGGRGNRPQFYSPQSNRGSQNPSQSKLWA